MRTTQINTDDEPKSAKAHGTNPVQPKTQRLLRTSSSITTDAKSTVPESKLEVLQERTHCRIQGKMRTRKFNDPATTGTKQRETTPRIGFQVNHPCNYDMFNENSRATTAATKKRSNPWANDPKMKNDSHTTPDAFVATLPPTLCLRTKDL